jgi:hypothetical protein
MACCRRFSDMPWQRQTYIAGYLFEA